MRNEPENQFMPTCANLSNGSPANVLAVVKATFYIKILINTNAPI